MVKKADELKQSIKDDIKESDDMLATIKALSDAAPHIEERKQELQTLYVTLERMPDGIIEEIAPRLLIAHRDSREQFHTQVPDLADLSHIRISPSPSTGTAGTFYAEIAPVYDRYVTEPWAKDLLTPLDDLAQHKAAKSALSVKLAKLSPELPGILLAATDSYEKSKSGIAGLDQAAMRMRDVIQQLWGELAAKAQQNCGPRIGKARLELSKLQDRQKVSICLALNQKENELLYVLDQLSQLHLDLSAPAKNPSFGNRGLLDDFYTRLILHTDSLFTWSSL
jgi:hypothetical protein